MSLWDFELFAVNRVVVFEVDSVLVIFGLSKVIFVDADGLLVFVQQIEVLMFELVRYLEIASPGNVFHDELTPGMLWNVPLDNRAYFCGGFICKGVHFVLFNLDETHEVVSFNGNFVWSAVFNDDFADLIVVDVDDRRYSCQCRKSWAVYR